MKNQLNQQKSFKLLACFTTFRTRSNTFLQHGSNWQLLYVSFGFDCASHSFELTTRFICTQIAVRVLCPEPHVTEHYFVEHLHIVLNLHKTRNHQRIHIIDIFKIVINFETDIICFGVN